jgi:hypothetical protein
MILNKRGIVMNKVLSISVLVVFILSSCSSIVPVINYNYSQDGSTNNAQLAVKDFESLGIIFVKSSESTDGNRNHTGSKITYEMLMIEAKKIGADDIINIKIDVNKIEEKIKGNNGNIVTKITYNYTASALAIKYTSAIIIENNSGYSQNIGKTMIISKPEGNSSTSSSRKAGITLGIILGAGALAGIALMTSLL